MRAAFFKRLFLCGTCICCDTPGPEAISPAFPKELGSVSKNGPAGMLPAGPFGMYALFQSILWCRFAAVKRFCISMARVMGPTPPGTGVI